MPDYKHTVIKYKNSPIILAILEIRYEDPNLKNIEKFSDFKNQVVKFFPNSQKQLTSQLRVDNLSEGQTSISLSGQKVDCFLYSSVDKQTEFTIALDKFNYRQSGPYSSFDDFVKNAKEVWAIHYPLLKDIVITGISLRCFNKIEINEIFDDPSEFFNISIQAGEDIIKDVVTNYSIRYITHSRDGKRHAIIALSLENRTVNSIPFILDIDVHETEPLKNDLDLLWEKFESLRIEKNRLFNTLITNKTKDILNELQ